MPREITRSLPLRRLRTPTCTCRLSRTASSCTDCNSRKGYCFTARGIREADLPRHGFEPCRQQTKHELIALRVWVSENQIHVVQSRRLLEHHAKLGRSRACARTN